MPRLVRPITDKSISGKLKPGLHPAGDGLYLSVGKARARSWIFRYRIGEGARRRVREMGLGSLRDVPTLAAARALAEVQRQHVRAGRDPLEVREAEQAAKALSDALASITFDEAAKRFIAGRKETWRNEKHRNQWTNTIATYASPHFGTEPVGSVATKHVTAALTPIWTDKPETASRLRGRIEAILDFAKVQGWRGGENPARWSGHLSHLLPARSAVRSVTHHAALPWRELPALFDALLHHGVRSADALRFTILCAARTSEVILARWTEVDLKQRVWTIPPARMKTKREHRVPLTSAALDLLKAIAKQRETPDGYVFPGARSGKPLSNMSMAKTLASLGRADITVHGFRSTFRDWAGETTNHPREVVEAALAHRTGDKVEQAYARGDLFTKRRRLMEDWAAFAISQPGAGLV